jgi:membrane associated rhomboid family serine protease
MGFQDREYYRDGTQSFYVTSMVVKLIIINGIVFLAELLAGQYPLDQVLAVHPDTIVRPLYWWQFLTAGFVHDPRSVSHVFLNMFGLYVFGRPLEDRLGRREFLRLYLVAIVLGFVVWSAANYLAAGGLPAGQAAQYRSEYSCLGASGGVTALVILFCALNPRATVFYNFLFPMPAWLMGAMVVLGDLLLMRRTTLGPQIAYDVHLTGAAFALAYWYFGWNLGRLPGMDELQRLFKAPRKWFKPRPPLRVHDPEQSYEDLDAEADRVLDKINREGLDKLNSRERRILEDYSRRTRQKLR